MSKTKQSDEQKIAALCEGLDGGVIPYARIEFIHPRSGKHEIVEFTADGNTESVEREIYFECEPRSSAGFFVAGMLWAGAIASLLWVILRH